jgi:hypothetical protein
MRKNLFNFNNHSHFQVFSKAIPMACCEPSAERKYSLRSTYVCEAGTATKSNASFASGDYDARRLLQNVNTSSSCGI